MPVIYKATNRINGKAYIGFAVNFENRKAEHLRKARSGKDKQYFHNAIADYGEENFEWEILISDATLEDEVFMIECHDTFWETGLGYNLTRGGEGKLGYVTSQETKDKIRDAHIGMKPTERQLTVLRENARKMKETGHTEETKEKIRAAHLARPPFTDEHRMNISVNHAARKETGAFYKSIEYRQTMSEAITGKVRTPEQRERYRQAALNRTPEHKEAIRLAKLKKKEEKLKKDFS